MTIASDRDQLADLLGGLARHHRVPGAVLGVLRLNDRAGDDDALAHSDEQVVVSHGVLGLDTEVGTTDDSLFQIGSITKVWTATVALQLVDEGLLQLDTPVAEVLPELRLSDPDVTKSVTLRHLLTHTSGIDGDVFTDCGRGDDCLEVYVDQLDGVAQNHPLGATWSYCNSGYVLLGRVIEKVTGSTWDAALRERLFRPLGLQHTVTLPEEALLHRAAIGHVGEPPEPLRQAPVWMMPRSLGPAGLISASAADVLTFARLHLTGGRAGDGSTVLSEAAVREMAAWHAEVPEPYLLGDSWGLGWIRFGWGDARLIGHDGSTVGQGAFLRILPERGLAVVLLTNGGNARDLYEDLFRQVFDELAGVAMREPLAPPDAPPALDIRPHLGRYERASIRFEVRGTARGARLRTTVTGSLAELVPDDEREAEHDLVPVAPDLYAFRPTGTDYWVPVVFYRLDDGSAYLHTGGRATPKVS